MITLVVLVISFFVADKILTFYVNHKKKIGRKKYKCDACKDIKWVKKHDNGEKITLIQCFCQRKDI